MSTIYVNEHLHLSPPTESDIDNISDYCNDLDIHANTLTIPYPYTRKDAENFLFICDQKRKEFGQDVIWAIRDEKKDLIGTVGLLRIYGSHSHRDEIGYWLAKPYRNKGVMTTVLKRFCAFLFDNFNLVRIEAHVFLHNEASSRTLLKAGFEFEGVRKKYHFKDGKYLDCKLFALVL